MKNEKGKTHLHIHILSGITFQTTQTHARLKHQPMIGEGSPICVTVEEYIKC